METAENFNLSLQDLVKKAQENYEDFQNKVHRLEEIVSKLKYFKSEILFKKKISEFILEDEEYRRLFFGGIKSEKDVDMGKIKNEKSLAYWSQEILGWRFRNFNLDNMYRYLRGIPLTETIFLTEYSSFSLLNNFPFVKPTEFPLKRADEIIEMIKKFPNLCVGLLPYVNPVSTTIVVLNGVPESITQEIGLDLNELYSLGFESVNFGKLKILWHEFSCYVYAISSLKQFFEFWRPLLLKNLRDNFKENPQMKELFIKWYQSQIPLRGIQRAVKLSWKEYTNSYEITNVGYRSWGSISLEDVIELTSLLLLGVFRVQVSQFLKEFIMEPLPCIGVSLRAGSDKSDAFEFKGEYLEELGII